jgi:FKBP-type peptidyl-prolyl cis-trans isomerase FkpA
MKQINYLLFALLGMLSLVACNSHGLKKTKSGLLYKIISDEKNPLVKRGQFVRISYVQKIRDSVLFSSAGSMPAYVRIDSGGQNSYSPVEIFQLLRKGDSVVIIQLGDSIEKKSHQPLPPFIHKNDKLILTMRVEEVFDNEAAVTKDRAGAVDSFHAKQIAVVEDYLKAHNITATKTPQGAFVQIQTAGDGPLVDSGKQVTVIYTGKLFPSGKVFETNDDGKKPPIKFVVGRRAVIPGWDDCLRFLKKGSSATLYIPAFLAYDQQMGPGKTPNENLIFDVKVLDITDAPPPAPMQMPQGMNPNMRNMPRPQPAPAQK